MKKIDETEGNLSISHTRNTFDKNTRFLPRWRFVLSCNPVALVIPMNGI